jgi:hypothetical protein
MKWEKLEKLLFWDPLGPLRNFTPPSPPWPVGPVGSWYGLEVAGARE